MQHADRSYSEKLRNRILLVAAGFGLLFFVLIARAFQVQVIQFDVHDSYARALQTFTQELNYRRGPIVDDKGVPLAVSVDVRSVVANPRAMTAEQKKTATAILSRELDIPPAQVARSLEKDRYFVWIKRQAPDEAVERIKAANLRGSHLPPREQAQLPAGDAGGPTSWASSASTAAAWTAWSWSTTRCCAGRRARSPASAMPAATGSSPTASTSPSPPPAGGWS